MPGKYLEWAWHMLGISLACAWNMLGMCLAYAAYSMHTQSGTALQHEKPKKMVKVPSECLTWSIMLGICLEYAWNMLGICWEYVWNKLGMCLENTWNKLGICLAYAWTKLGMCLEYAWNKLGMCLAYAWHMVHIPCILSQALPCNMKSPRKW